MEPEGSLPHSQEPATCPYPEPDQCSSCPASHFLKKNISIILVLPSGLFPSTPTPCMCLSCLPCVPQALSISLFFIWSTELYLVRIPTRAWLFISRECFPRRADPSPRGVLPTVYVSSGATVILCTLKWIRRRSQTKKINILLLNYFILCLFKHN